MKMKMKIRICGESGTYTWKYKIEGSCAPLINALKDKMKMKYLRMSAANALGNIKI